MPPSLCVTSTKTDNKFWNIGDGVIQDTSGDVIFNVSFKAIACMPEQGEVLDGRIIEVNQTGINV